MLFILYISSFSLEIRSSSLNLLNWLHKRRILLCPLAVISPIYQRKSRVSAHHKEKHPTGLVVKWYSSNESWDWQPLSRPLQPTNLHVVCCCRQACSRPTSELHTQAKVKILLLLSKKLRSPGICQSLCFLPHVWKLGIKMSLKDCNSWIERSTKGQSTVKMAIIFQLTMESWNMSGLSFITFGS